MDLKNLSSNWKKLQASGTVTKLNDSQLSKDRKSRQSTKFQQPQNGTLKRKRNETEGKSLSRTGNRPTKQLRIMSGERVDAKKFVVQREGQDGAISANEESRKGDHINEGLAKDVEVGKYIAVDCEMVGVGPHPHLESALARVSIVNYNGEQVYDSYVKPQEDVTDWRTHVSGIQPKHMLHARSFEEVQADVAQLMKGRIVVGHSVRSDFDALFLDHPKRDIRDTARHPPYRKLAGGGSPKLKILASELLGLDIQAGEHSSIEDARATILLFRKDKEAFEREHMKKWGPAVVVKKVEVGEGSTPETSSKKPKKKKKKKR